MVRRYHKRQKRNVESDWSEGIARRENRSAFGRLIYQRQERRAGFALHVDRGAQIPLSRKKKPEFVRAWGDLLWDQYHDFHRDGGGGF